MKYIKRPLPINEEIELSPYKTIMSKTDKKGIIEYANEYFMEVSGYKEWELMGQPHNIIRHPDMPKVIFKLLWNKLNEGEPMMAIVKNLSKDGRYYWVIADFFSKLDKDGNVISHYARRKAVPNEVKEKISKLYKILLEIEKNSGIDASQAYLEGFLEDKSITYFDLILNLLKLDKKQLHEYMSAEIKDEEFNLSIKDNDISINDAIKKSKKKSGFLKKLFK